ncbi:branched-chain amino acid ABC transporter permease [Neobacillus drentensis]|uniref:branched-chain amino acid ABC transporter permease n=1 Tax=Neobacillus drentensis TaxID=220684 RepID=UPI00285811A0|nr:branched-chain amino acid ABC transporter permease [Neobacillus drentensis]MDR7238091.1 branched-chain amino acid transport system permease protein [Neobacillus drentensis]
MNNLFQNKKIFTLTVIGIIVVLLPLMITNGYYLQILIVAGIWSMVVLGLDLLVGYTGYVSFGHAAFFGIGGYTSAILVMKLGMPFWLSLPLAAIFTGIIGYIISKPTFRLSGTYFAIGTLAFAEIVNITFNNWESVTGGVYGLIGVPPLFANLQQYYYFVYFALVVIGYLIYRLATSPVGKALIATRENEALAQSIGINILKMKQFVFTLSCVIAGFAGALLVHLVGFASPLSFNVNTSLELIVIIMVGGAGTLFGPVFGAFFLLILSQYLAAFTELRLMIYGLVLILVIKYLPGGIAGRVKLLFQLGKKKRREVNGTVTSTES